MDDMQVKKGMQMELGTEGSMGFYAITTIVGDTACEEIEMTRAAVLKQVGIAAGVPRAHTEQDSRQRQHLFPCGKCKGSAIAVEV